MRFGVSVLKFTWARCPVCENSGGTSFENIFDERRCCRLIHLILWWILRKYIIVHVLFRFVVVAIVEIKGFFGKHLDAFLLLCVDWWTHTNRNLIELYTTLAIVQNKIHEYIWSIQFGDGRTHAQSSHSHTHTIKRSSPIWAGFVDDELLPLLDEWLLVMLARFLSLRFLSIAPWNIQTKNNENSYSFPFLVVATAMDLCI